MKIETKYNYGDVVYFRTDIEQQQYIITGFSCRPGRILYILADAGNEYMAYDFEITKERNQLKSLGIEN